jgi:hypothetical protein
MNKNKEVNNLESVIKATEYKVACMMAIKDYQDEQGECTCSLSQMTLDMQTSLIVFKETIDEELLGHHYYQVAETIKQFHDYIE